MKALTNLSMKNRIVTTVAALVLVATSVAGGGTPVVALPVCGATNVGCESGASAGLPTPCSALGWLYRKEYVASWACSGSTSSNYSCDDQFDEDNCCGSPNTQSCPSASCPCR